MENYRIYSAGSKWYVQSLLSGIIEFRGTSKQSCEDYINYACVRASRVRAMSN